MLFPRMLYSETDMEDFATQMARAARAGDCITLSGDLGTGKTTFARAFIRALTVAETEVPSPTFTLVQTYDVTLADGAPCALWHADFYRLEAAREVAATGIEDAFSSAITLIEWPDVAAELLPETRLDIRLSLGDAPNARRVECVPHGGWEAARRNAAKDAFIRQAGYKNFTRTMLAGDASFRKYDRVQVPGKTLVLMDAPPAHEDTRPFVAVAEHLTALGFSAPCILASDSAQGFLLLEDLGDDSFTRLLAANPARERELYLAATDALVALHHAPRGAEINLPPYDAALLSREVSLFADWFLPAALGAEKAAALRDEFLTLWTALMEKIPLHPPVLVLRDYHADNLLWLPKRSGVQRVGLLDFQDAVRGHPAYDLVSILEDARRDVSPETVRVCLEYYVEKSGVAAEDFYAAYALLGAQRNCKIIGIFTRLCVRDGKPHYLNFLPRVWAHLAHDLQHPSLAELRGWMAAHVPPAQRGVLAA